MFWRRPPRFNGYIDYAGDGRIAGWVVDAHAPNRPVEAIICAQGVEIGRVKACAPRADLAAAGIGAGRCGFTFAYPADLAAETLGVRTETGFWLPDSTGRHAFPPRDAASLMNAPRQGFPLLRPVLAQRTVDDGDIVIAEEMRRIWRAAAPRAHRAIDARSMWRSIVRARHRRLSALLQGEDSAALARYLVDLQKAPEAAGIVQGDEAYKDFLAASPEGRRAAVAPFHDMLCSLAQYVGVARADCAEQNFVGATLARPSQDLADGIAAEIGFALAAPTVFDGLYGLAIDGAILHGRDIQALYAALRVRETAGRAAPRVCEIGGGFGQVAYYALLAGVRAYTIVDLPTVAMMQYYALRRAGAPVFVDGAQTAPAGGGVRLVFADAAQDDTFACDVALNCDSFPEMGETTCRAYLRRLAGKPLTLLSINQEGAQMSGAHPQIVVGDLAPDYGFFRLSRSRSWVRRGFVEEVWRSPAAA